MIFKKKLFNLQSSNITFSKQSFLGIFDFWLNHPQITRVVKKTVKIFNLPYYLSHFIKKIHFSMLTFFL